MSHTSMAFFKSLTDGLNYAEYPIAQYEPSYFERNIVEIAFFHNMIFVRKGSNDEGTNAPDLIQKELGYLEDQNKTTEQSISASYDTQRN